MMVKQDIAVEEFFVVCMAVCTVIDTVACNNLSWYVFSVSYLVKFQTLGRDHITFQ